CILVIAFAHKRHLPGECSRRRHASLGQSSQSGTTKLDEYNSCDNRSIGSHGRESSSHSRVQRSCNKHSRLTTRDLKWNRASVRDWIVVIIVKSEAPRRPVVLRKRDCSAGRRSARCGGVLNCYRAYPGERPGIETVSNLWNVH